MIHDFPSKYPLATIHLLLGIVGEKIEIDIPATAFAPLFFTDGAWQNLLRYPENCLNWLSWMGASNSKSPLHALFHSKVHSLHESMTLMYNFYRERDTITVTNERGDRLRISSNEGHPFNVVEEKSGFSIKPDAKNRIERFIGLISKLTGWNYDSILWSCWEGLALCEFTKKTGDKLNGPIYNGILNGNVLSFAITARNQIEYTLETPARLS